MSIRGLGRGGQGEWNVEVEVTRRAPEDPMVHITDVRPCLLISSRAAVVHSSGVEVGRLESKANSGWLGTAMRGAMSEANREKVWDEGVRRGAK